MSINPPLNLNRLVPWTKVLEEFGIHGLTGMLPCTIRCPLCRDNHFTIFHDTVCGGEWHYCSSCGSYGDMIELMSKRLSLTYKQTIEYMFTQLDERPEYTVTRHAVENYEMFVGFRRKMTKFWNMMSKRALGDLATRQLRIQLGVATELTREVWERRGGQVIGTSTRREFEAYYERNNCDSPFQGFGLSSRKWNDILVIPFWDLPKRISAFCYAVADVHDKAEIKKYVSAFPPAARTSTVSNVPGVAMLDALYTHNHMVNDAAFVMLDPLLAVKCHIKHLQYSSDVPPIVAVYPEAKPAAILREHTNGRKLVFFSEKISSDLFKHAKAANGYIALNHAVEETIIEFLRRVTVQEWLEKLEREAKPWEQVLEEYLVSASIVDVGHILNNIGWSAQELSEFIDRSSEETKQRVKAASKQQTIHRVTDIGTRHIVDTERGWVLLPNNELICNANIKLIEVVHNHSTKLIYYRGEILLNGEVIPFVAEKEEFDKKPLRWIDRFLISNSKGTLTFNAVYERHALLIMKRFNPPKVVSGVDSYGWDETNARFVLPRYSVYVGGTVEEHSIPAPGIDNLPAINLNKPTELTRDEWKALLDGSHDSILTWQLAACVLHNIFSVPYNYSSCGIAVIGPAVRATVELAKYMGCPVIDKRLPNKQLIKTSWPTVFYGNVTTANTVLCSWLHKQPNNCIMPLSVAIGSAVAMTGNWLRIIALGDSIRPVVASAAEKIIPCMLKHMATRRMRRYGSNTDTFEQTRTDLIKWVDECGKDFRDVDSATSFVWHQYERSQADVLWELISYLYNNHRLIYIEKGTTKESERLKSVVVEIDDNLLWISKHGLMLSARVEHIHAPLIDTYSVGNILLAAGEIVDERSYEGEPGWVIKKDTWIQRLTLTKKS